MYRTLSPFKIAALAALSMLAFVAAAFGHHEALLIAPAVAADWDMLNKTMDKIELKLASLPELADRVMQLEQRGRGGPEDYALKAAGQDRTIGRQAVEQFEKNAELFAKTGSVRLTLKAASDPITTGQGRAIATGGAGAPAAQVLGIQNGLPTRTIGATTALEYSRFTGITGAAAQQAAEGDAKAAVRPEHSIITQKALTIAGWSRISRQAMRDRNALVGAIDVVLRRSVGMALDAALVTGATDFTGGLAGLATAYTSALYTGIPDAVSEGIATMQQAGFEPDLVALNPVEWMHLTVAVGDDGHYLSGSYLGVLPYVMRGLRVVLSSSVAAGKALLIDTAHTELLIVDEYDVQMSESDGDNFTKNLVTIRGEMRVLPIFLSVGAARLITPAAS